MQQHAIDQLEPGDKLIFVRFGGTLSTATGNVFTFARWAPDLNNFHDWNPGRYWQCQEILDQGNISHSMDIWACELFDPAIHKVHRLMNPEELEKDYKQFVLKYGS